MKNIKHYFLYTAVLMLLITGCSKEETGAIDDPAQNSSTVDLTFGAVLNDLSNRAMSRAHFEDIPDCAEADPAYAEIVLSYEGGSGDMMVNVDVLHDDDGWFTDYSDDLKIPVPNNGSVQVTLKEFKIYDTSDALIWAAPVETEEADFAGYVDDPLPIQFDVEDGTKPYFDVEVLCFDRRMANEYGYVFFDIIPDTVYPLCLFFNYCNADGRHYVLNYSVDLFYAYGTPDQVELYNHLDENAMATVGDYNANNDQDPLYYADPLCLVVPGKPDNLGADAPYLTLMVYPEDWEGNYGTIDDTPVRIDVSWSMIAGLLNDDGETTEYLHRLIGECEGAINGDGGGNGGTECDLMDPNADCDDDDVLNKCDTDNPNWATFDCDGDGIVNGQDDCPTVAPTTDVDQDGCEDQTVECNLTISNPDEACEFRAIAAIPDSNYDSSAFLEVSFDTGVPLLEDSGSSYGPSAGSFGVTLTASGLEYTFNTGSATVNEYLIEVSDSSGGDVYCTDQNDINMTVEGSFSYPVYIRVKANICEPAQ